MFREVGGGVFMSAVKKYRVEFGAVIDAQRAYIGTDFSCLALDGVSFAGFSADRGSIVEWATDEDETDSSASALTMFITEPALVGLGRPFAMAEWRSPKTPADYPEIVQAEKTGQFIFGVLGICRGLL